ncbi:hypothetical protein KHQ06_14840 [Nocardia tengchongensis]|uniref:Uncharacterized protein n=1 Tax=Nocardia tengchongensis TaxID=2055889 RepID=A0ABX8CZQ3_9NOCA|nr:hypothetical protein [Nocardia tengchongensis]QVI23955.1 hypothetical protein KHQ06_14840 [Nocardia tengchongensis]
MAELDREQLIELVARIQNVAGSEEQLDEWLGQIQDSVADPHISDYLFWDFTEPPLTLNKSWTEHWRTGRSCLADQTRKSNILYCRVPR